MSPAEAFATRAHAGQLDKGGRPYIEHPARVAARARQIAERLEYPSHVADGCEAAGWLHDTIEDTGTTQEDLHAAEFPGAVVRAVQLLSRPAGVPYAGFIQAIIDSGDVVALLVKLADVEDNTNPARPSTATLPRSLHARYGSAKYSLRNAIRLGGREPLHAGQW
ncbi:HD domain-containing protein [Methylobacterium gnaphalii]|uniref:HD/PDEase domain-containing protein n=1 Tax=Methylobacterium gnaphalii TaxID=1010610 RepID=A0A512JP89_9HYPH|nr:HD domain-containing protein [Methylobacterium gnaphalii]GEP11776.1 hypothetical protein MGN01_36210 [Methylobacterium gnaphalii]GJD69453.1 GTP pyrophosphokinase [Methylobacterium gnaphalii]GLS49589.1 hypothetical protein GCM10007885_24380 [Methylobacterium gnaphalii]